MDNDIVNSIIKIINLLPLEHKNVKHIYMLVLLMQYVINSIDKSININTISLIKDINSKICDKSHIDT